MKREYILALDQGTSSSRAIVYDSALRTIAVEQCEFTQHYPQEGWVEHDPEEIWETQYAVARRAIRKAGIAPQQIASIGITNQRETAIVWERATGKPICNAIVWMCRRTADYCSSLIAQGWAEKIREKTGLVADAYFSATKVRWMLQNVPGAMEKARQGELLFGTVDSWLLYKLTGGRVHATDYTNASRTMLFNIFTGKYDSELLSLMDIPADMLPEVLPSSGEFGQTAPELFDGACIPICGIAGDQQAALFGHGCFRKGMAKNTYGTGCFTLMNTGTEPMRSAHGLLTTIAVNLDGATYYALEGSVFNAGSSIQWLRDELHLIGSAMESERCARAVPDTGGVYMVPAFSGLGAPYWDMYARGAILGITRGATRNHIVRAVLEGIAFETRDVLEAMAQDSGSPIGRLEVDGGACANDFLMQFQADILGAHVLRPLNIEVTALGAAYLAALGCGLIPSLDALTALTYIEREFAPEMGAGERQKRISGWEKAVSRSRDWAER